MVRRPSPFGHPDFQGERFLAGAAEMLDGVQVFWEGLGSDTEAHAKTTA